MVILKQRGFMIRTHDEKEIIDLVKQHTKILHKMDVTEKDVRAKKTQAMRES